tara:strand:- start:2358 stop:3347 length:990 start_codon:yes stop_codon:yes gene_type:complete
MSEKEYDSLSKALRSLYTPLVDIQAEQDMLNERSRGAERIPEGEDMSQYSNIPVKTPEAVVQMLQIEGGLAKLPRAIPKKVDLSTVAVAPTPEQIADANTPRLGDKIDLIKKRESVGDTNYLQKGETKKPKEAVGDKPDYVSQTIKTLENYNLPIDAIAGIMGNILVEAPDANPNTIEKTTKKDKGRGLFQYSTGTDKKGALPFYKDYLEENNLTDSMENQIGFAMKEIMNPRESKWLGYQQANKLKKLLKTGNVEQVTKGFLKIFEKPEVEHLQRRLDNSNNIYKRLLNEQGEYIENLIKQREEFLKQEKQSGGMIEKDPYKRQPRFI